MGYVLWAICCYLQPLAPDGTQRPVEPLTLQTSCLSEVLGVQHAPLGTGRLSFWGLGAAAARATMAKKERVNFMLARLVVWESGIGYKAGNGTTK